MIAMVYLVLTLTMHPWYAACYLVVFLPFATGSTGMILAGLSLAGLMLSWTVLLSYRVLISIACMVSGYKTI